MLNKAKALGKTVEEGFSVSDVEEYIATGRRKEAVARVRLHPGEGNITVNGRPYQDYFPRKSFQLIIEEPFKITGTLGNYDVKANIVGGGLSGQAGALRHGLSRALEKAGDHRAILKKAGMLTRDARVKERKKYGLHKARRGHQFSKR